MQPTKTDFTVEGDLGGEVVKMTVNQDSLAHIMSVLTNLYENPLLAVIREYSTNAWDSHVAAGVNRPIEVTTPNYLSSTLKIKDYGVGMDANDIRSIYSQYGASTKRGTNEQTGMLGLGCKSALTYTGQFNIVAVKAGVRTSVVVSRSEDGAGMMEIIDESPTSEPNGVEIIIPAQNKDIVLREATAFFRFWEDGTILLNGKKPKSIWDTAERVGPFYIVEDSFDYVVMGNVAYPVGNSITGNSGWYRERIVAKVNIGEVNFTPSRESLQMTKLTKDKLAELKTSFRAEVIKTIESKISSSATYLEAYDNFNRMRNQTTFADFMSNVKFKGETFKQRADFDWVISNIDANQPSAHVGDNTYLNNLKNFVFINGFDCKRLNSMQKTKINMYLTSKGINLTPIHVVINKEKPESKWFSELPHYEWSDVKKVQLPKGPKAQKQPENWDVLIDRRSRRYNQKVDTTKTVIFGSGAEINGDSDRVLNVIMNDQTQFILVGKNRWTKFKEAYPTAVHFLDYAKLKVLEYMNNGVKNDISIMEKDMSEIQIIAQLDLKKVDDPAINTLVFQDDTKTQWDAQQRYNKYLYASYELNIPGFPERPYASNKVSLLKKYPLITRAFGRSEMRGIDFEHIYAYMNAVYKLGL